jgi:hypothetical protein
MSLNHHSATAFTLLVPSISDCSATVSINGSSPTPACPTDSSAITVPGLPDGVHQVTWFTGLLKPDEQVVFWGISGTRSLSSGFSNLTIDDTYADAGPVALSYQGTWDHWGGGNETNAYNGTLSVTNVPGASVTISGPGEHHSPGISPLSLVRDMADRDQQHPRCICTVRLGRTPARHP